MSSVDWQSLSGEPERESPRGASGEEPGWEMMCLGEVLERSFVSISFSIMLSVFNNDDGYDNANSKKKKKNTQLTAQKMASFIHTSIHLSTQFSYKIERMNPPPKQDNANMTVTTKRTLFVNIEPLWRTSVRKCKSLCANNSMKIKTIYCE